MSEFRYTLKAFDSGLICVEKVLKKPVVFYWNPWNVRKYRTPAQQELEEINNSKHLFETKEDAISYLKYRFDAKDNEHPQESYNQGHRSDTLNEQNENSRQEKINKKSREMYEELKQLKQQVCELKGDNWLLDERLSKLHKLIDHVASKSKSK